TAVTRQLDKAELPLPLPVIGAEHAPHLVEALRQERVEIKPGPDDAERAVREQDADVVLRIPEKFAGDWSRGEPAQVEIIYDASQRDAAGNVERLRAMLDAYSTRVGALRLVARGLSPAVTRPIAIAARDQSTSQSRSGTLFGMLPYFFIL